MNGREKPGPDLIPRTGMEGRGARLTLPSPDHKHVIRTGTDEVLLSLVLPLAG